MPKPNLGGRPEIGPKVEIRLPADIAARIAELAKEEGVNRSEMIRRLLREALAAHT
ncbi:CopG family transcriptional regulator [Streptomyces kaniharaensis]|uniref:CopG family transcriptional regulator n=1 Tax=Streptomyces kaniharaensis TaxID=212423 RepID=A0A6N7L710_9ACTN|nr:CopG family transcriptional regulator [Streptomyces kaniharaensis]